MRAATMKRTSEVRAAMAPTMSRGLGRYSSGDPWCSDTAMLTHPRRSAHAAMSRAAA